MTSDAGSSTARKLANFHARGILTTDQAVLLLVLESAYESPSSLAAGLSDALIVALRDYCSRPPEAPEEAPQIGVICGGIDVDSERWRRENSQAWFDGVLRWHECFYARQSMATDPPAEGHSS